MAKRYRVGITALCCCCSSMAIIMFADFAGAQMPFPEITPFQINPNLLPPRPPRYQMQPPVEIVCATSAGGCTTTLPLGSTCQCKDSSGKVYSGAVQLQLK